MERMKRLRAAALNKTFQKDVLTTTQKKANEERDRLARLQHERVALERRRSRSPSPRSQAHTPPCCSTLTARWFSSFEAPGGGEPLQHSLTCQAVLYCTQPTCFTQPPLFHPLVTLPC